MGILCVMLAATLPAVRGLLQSSARVAAVDGVMAHLVEVRMTAMAQGRPAYLVFADHTFPEERRCRAVCLYRQAEDPADPPVRVTPWRELPAGYGFRNEPGRDSLFTAPPAATPLPFLLAGESEPRTLPYLEFGPTGTVDYPVESRWARLFLFRGFTAPDGSQVPTQEGAHAAPPEQIAISKFTGKPAYRLGE